MKMVKTVMGTVEFRLCHTLLFAASYTCDLGSNLNIFTFLCVYTSPPSTQQLL